MIKEGKIYSIVRINEGIKAIEILSKQNLEIGIANIDPSNL